MFSGMKSGVLDLHSHISCVWSAVSLICFLVVKSPSERNCLVPSSFFPPYIGIADMSLVYKSFKRRISVGNVLCLTDVTSSIIKNVAEIYTLQCYEFIYCLCRECPLLNRRYKKYN